MRPSLATWVDSAHPTGLPHQAATDKRFERAPTGPGRHRALGGMRVRPSCQVRGSGASLRVWRPSDQGWWRQWLRELLGVELSWGTGLMAYAIGHPLFPSAWTEIKLRSRLWVPNRFPWRATYRHSPWLPNT